MKVGDTVYLKPVNNMARGMKNNQIIENTREAKITKIGRKFYYVNGMKFEIGSKRNYSNYSADYEVYNSLQEVIDEMEYQKIYSELCNKISWVGGIPLTLDKVRRIKQIIDE